MKTCPICKATCFDDMEVCYGCLHRFGAEPSLDIPIIEPAMPIQQQPAAVDEPRGRHSIKEQSSASDHSGSRASEPLGSGGQVISATPSSRTTVDQSTELARQNDLPSWIPIAVLGGGQDGLAMPSVQNKNGTAMQYRLVLGLQPVQV